MDMSRREFLRALTHAVERMLAALAMPAADPPPDSHQVYLPFVARSGGAYATDLGAGVWSIGNDLIEQRIAFAGSGLFSVSLRHKASGRDWCSSVSSPVFTLREEDADLDAASGWSFMTADIAVSGTEAALRISLEHADRPIRAHTFFQVWSDAPVVRTWNEYENIGTSPRRLQSQSFCNLALNAVGNLEAVWVWPFSWLPGYSSDTFSVRRETLTNNQQRQLLIGPYAAYDRDPGDATQRTACGWFVLHRPAMGAGLFCGVEWSGACVGRVGLNDSGEGRMGVEHWQPTFTHLTAPGEHVASPAAFVGLFDGTLDEATHQTRTLAAGHYIPPRPSIRVPAGAEFPYVMADTWGYGSNIDEVSVRAFVDRAAEIGVEAVTIDEGWEARIGDWVSHPARFPSGLRATVDYIHSKGMAAGLWLAFGNATPNSAVVQIHPDWLATRNGFPLIESFGTNVLCLSHPAARAWVAAEFDRILAEFDVDWLVQDFETIARCDNPAHAAWHTATDAEYRNVLALWEVIAGVRARHPGVMIENNWSGGRVLDFGMLKHYDTALCDDYNQAARNRVASFGVTHFFPPTFVSKYMGTEELPFDYQTRSYLFGGPWNLMIDLSQQDAAQLASAVSVYKGLRGIIRDGRVYHLKAPVTRVSGSYRYQIDWDAIQAVALDASRSVVLVGRGLGGQGVFNVKLRGLNPSTTYAGVSTSGASYGQRSGADLMASGFDVSLVERSHDTILWSS